MFNRPASHLLVTPNSHPSLGININGPSLVRMPGWATGSLGKYHLYFASHHGRTIRLAYSDSPLGPFRIYAPGVLPLESTPFSDHIASPDVHIDEENRRVLMVYHGGGYRNRCPLPYAQASAFAESANGVNFRSYPRYLGPPYLRFFRWKNLWYGLAGNGSRRWFRTRNLAEDYEPGPILDITGETFEENPDLNRRRMRHPALDFQGGQVDVYYSNVADTPERIKRTSVVLDDDWTTWTGGPPREILQPESPEEGSDRPPDASRSGCSCHPQALPVRQLRDPFVFREDERTFLYYTVAGERGIAVAVGS